MTEDLCSLSLKDLRQLIGRKTVSCVDVLNATLDRIEGVNPAVNAIVALDENRARAAAERADRAVADGNTLGPLHGIPVAIKDLLNTSGLRTTYGSRAYADHVPDADDPIVARLRQAGAIIVGKSNTPEFGAGANTQNQVYGITGNPFDPALTCGGSSGGSAVALATGMVPLATGSDFGGSLRTPAAFCGIVGFRPSPGIVPNVDDVRGWSILSVEGLMARTVGDLALGLSTIAGEHSLDPRTGHWSASHLYPLMDIDPSGLRIGTSEDFGVVEIDESIRTVFRDRMARLSSSVATIGPVEPDFTGVHEAFEVLRGAEYAATHGDRLEEFGDLIGDLVTGNTRFGQTLALDQVLRADRARTDLHRRFQSLFDDIDVLISPTVAVSPFPKEQKYPPLVNGAPPRSYVTWIALTYALTLTAHPVVCLPCGLDSAGLPFGLQICGRRGRDREVLSIAQALERVMCTDPMMTRPRPDLARLAVA